MFEQVCDSCDKFAKTLTFTKRNGGFLCIPCVEGNPYEECPICYDQIMTKQSAFITNCGHAYHKKCLFKYIESKWLSTKYTSPARCPMCRSSLGHPDFVQRYKSSYFSLNYDDNNELDKLEDFWISFDLILPSFCSNSYDHYLGFDKNCFRCKSYRKTGNHGY
jgi:hypothetical protein